MDTPRQIPDGLDDLVEMRSYPTIDKEMSLRDGMVILAHRLGLSGAKIQALARDRYPTYETAKKERSNIKRFKIRCFLKFDIIFSDILHTGYGELKHLGIGRRFLVNRILRTVLAGICDGLDPSGRTGDFPPYSWMSADQASEMKKRQALALHVMKVYDAKLLQSVKVRLRRVATPILLDLVRYERRIRKDVRKAVEKDPLGGLRRFSDLLLDYKDQLYRRVRKEDIKNRQKARNLRKREPVGKASKEFRPLRNMRKYERAQYGSVLLIRGLTDLRKLLDPKVPNWYRRPTDPDWFEGQWADRRKPRTMNRRRQLARFGFGCIPGLTEPLEAKDWTSVNARLSTAEVRQRYQEHLKEQASVS